MFAVITYDYYSGKDREVGDEQIWLQTEALSLIS